MIGKNPDAGLVADRLAYEHWASTRPLPIGVRATPAARLGPGSRWIERDDVGEDPPIVVYVHGGGFRVGSPTTGTVVGAAIGARFRARVLVVGYSLAPEHPFPTAAAEVTLALEAVLDGETGARVLLAGDSAGANLALFALRHSEAAARHVAGVALLCPLVDLTEGSFAGVEDPGLSPAMFEAIRRDYLSGTRRAEPDDPDVSPVTATLTGMPPMFVQYSDAELLAPSIEEFVARAGEAGVDIACDRWERLQHFWQRFVGDDVAADEAVDRLAGWLRERSDEAAEVRRDITR